VQQKLLHPHDGCSRIKNKEKKPNSAAAEKLKFAAAENFCDGSSYLFRYVIKAKNQHASPLN